MNIPSGMRAIATVRDGRSISGIMSSQSGGTFFANTSVHGGGVTRQEIFRAPDIRIWWPIEERQR